MPDDLTKPWRTIPSGRVYPDRATLRPPIRPPGVPRFHRPIPHPERLAVRRFHVSFWRRLLRELRHLIGPIRPIRPIRAIHKKTHRNHGG